jgi:hypothetical protein
VELVLGNVSDLDSSNYARASINSDSVSRAVNSSLLVPILRYCWRVTGTSRFSQHLGQVLVCCCSIQAFAIRHECNIRVEQTSSNVAQRKLVTFIPFQKSAKVINRGALDVNSVCCDAAGAACVPIRDHLSTKFRNISGNGSRNKTL